MIKTLMSSIGEYKRVTILTPVFVVLSVIMEIIIPLLMAGLIDNGIDKGDMAVVWQYGGLLLAATFGCLLFGIASGRFSARASAGFARNLRRRLFYSVQDFSFTNIDHFSTAGLVTRLTTDVTNIQNAFMMIIMIAVRSPVTLIFAFVMTIRINGSLSLVFLGALPVLIVVMLLLMKYAIPLFKRIFKLYDKLNNVVRENVRGIRVVKSFVREEHENEKFRDVSGEIFTDFSRVEKMMALISPVMQFAVYVCILLISWLGAQFIIAGDMTTGQLMSLMTYTMQILMSLMMLGMIFVMMTMSRASAERICAVLNEKSDITNGEAPVTTVPDGSIAFRDVSFGYGGRDSHCLEHINIKIPSGATVGILGGTGSAKSTLVQLIPRLYDVSDGAVLVGGTDVRDYDIKTLRDAVAVVLQKNELFSGTIKDNLRWGNKDATDEQLVAACRTAQADGFIREFPEGYDTHIEQGGANVSGGQKQRLCIARALLKNPKILILDDSTSAVDMTTDAALRSAFRTELPDMTKLIIAQRIASVMEADMIIVMDNGRVGDMGTHEELLARCSIYQEVYNSQVKEGQGNDAA